MLSLILSVAIAAGSARTGTMQWVATPLVSRAQAIQIMQQRPEALIARTTEADYPYVAIEYVEADIVCECPFRVVLIDGGCIPNSQAIITLGDGRVAVIERVD